jgi:hypothetical protein
MTKQRSWTDQQLIEAIKTSSSKLEAIQKMGLKIPGSYKVVNKYIRILNLDISHFTTQQNRSLSYAKRTWSNDQMFVIDNDIDGGAVKMRVLRDSLIPYVCSECKLEELWNGKPINLQLDHKNGNSKDHRLENLRFLCPNCHSQTDTYCGRRLKTSPDGTCACGTRINARSKQCRVCAALKRHT